MIQDKTQIVNNFDDVSLLEINGDFGINIDQFFKQKLELRDEDLTPEKLYGNVSMDKLSLGKMHLNLENLRNSLAPCFKALDTIRD